MKWQAWLTWLEVRLPLRAIWQKQVAGYYAPKNLNFWYFFGSMALVILAIQLVTGMWLAMHYNPSAEQAFSSVEYIMREVPCGWLLRYMHTTGASFFFIVVYLHMFRGLLYGSYRAPRELLWIIGMVIYVCLMMEAFLGYLLPWGNMSFWGAQVITSLFGAIPYIGEWCMQFIRGDYTISGVTLNRFFALHVVVVPWFFVGLVVLHIWALHHVGSSNPSGRDLPKEQQIPFHPYYTVKDLFGVLLLLIAFFTVVFFFPEGGGYFLEAANFTEADLLKTPEHIAPVWYMTPYYAMLRAVPNKLLGVLVMAAAIGIFFLLPWLDKSKERVVRHKGWPSQVALAGFVISFIALGYLGHLQPNTLRTILARSFTVLYFTFFLGMPYYSRAVERGQGDLDADD
jgi:ubiquinol-cytochrome c reductase cytochrome b subunit